MTLSLEAFRTKLEPIELAPGRIVPVRAVDGVAWDMANEVDHLREAGKHVDAVRKLREIAAHLLPDATPDEIQRLENSQIEALIKYAGGAKIQELQTELLGNGSGAGTEPEAKPPAPRKTASRRSSRPLKSSS